MPLRCVATFVEIGCEGGAVGDEWFFGGQSISTFNLRYDLSS